MVYLYHDVYINIQHIYTEYKPHTNIPHMYHDIYIYIYHKYITMYTSIYNTYIPNIDHTLI